MKNTKAILHMAILIVVLVATFFVGCKKEKNEDLTQPKKTEAQALINKITAFQTLCESVDSGVKTEGVMSVEEMRQNLDLVTNFEHSEHMTPCVNTVLDTLYIAMPPVDIDGNITNMDVVTTYETFEKELLNRMETINDGRHIPSYFSILMPEKNAKAEENITIVFVRGEERIESKGSRNILDEDEPFIEDFDDWIWGMNYGFCKPDLINATTDASERLSLQFQFETPPEHQGEIGVISDVFHVNYRPCSDEIDNITSEFYIDNEMEDCADTWLFFQPTIVPENFLCILAFEMNCFWHSIHRNIADASAPLNSHEHPYLHNLEVPYHECSIHWSQFRNTKIDSPYYDYYFQVHYAHVIYCNLHWTGGIYPN